jgi:hypothetical protein
MEKRYPFSPMRGQPDKNVINEYRGLRLWNLNPKIAIAIADVLQKCDQENGRKEE